jgi:hypothetical protein
VVKGRAGKQEKAARTIRRRLMGGEMDRLKPEDVALLIENQRLVDHLFEKTISWPCYLTLYHRLTKDVKPILGKIGSLTHKDAPGLANDRATEESFMMDAIRPYVREMIKAQNNLASKEDDICQAYAHLVLDHEYDQSCDQILRGLRSLGFPTIPGDGTCS